MAHQSIQAELTKLGIIFSPETLHHGVRDDKSINVMRCSKTGVIFLNKIKNAEYEELNDLSYWGKNKSINWKSIINEDDLRRAKMLKPIIKNAKWMDVGTGLGGLIHLCHKKALEAHALEPQPGAQKWLKKHFNTFTKIEECPDQYFDVITLFHVFEHIQNPRQFLEIVFRKLKKGGIILIEVPHAKDALIDFYQSNAFKNFTFWSQHLILHTKESLTTYLKVAGFKKIKISNYQRYDMSNHLYWLSQNKPGGHMIWKKQFGAALLKEYDKFLCKKNLSDTLIAYAKK